MASGTRFLPPDELEKAEQTKRRFLQLEIGVVLGLTLGQAGWYALLNIVERLTRGEALKNQKSVINPAAIPDRPWLDAIVQLSDIVFGRVVPLLLVAFLLTKFYPPMRAFWATNGLKPASMKEAASYLSRGLALAAIIGIPGFGFYLAAKAIGINTTVVASGLQNSWWAYLVLILSAIAVSFYEEIIVVGYLFARLNQLYVSPIAVIVASALLRGSYHLYQGIGGFIGNVVMGAVFGWFYQRTKKLSVLIIAHAIIDIVAFIGYALLHQNVSWL